MIDIEYLKAENPIEDVIESGGIGLMGSGRYRRGSQHDSLVVDTARQFYVWNSKGHGHSGDVVAWLENEKGMSFKGAAEWLANRAGIPVLDWGQRQMASFAAQRARVDTMAALAGYFAGRLAASAAAMEWGTARGWTRETMEGAGCGFWDGDRAALLAELARLNIDSQRPEVVAVLGFQGDVSGYLERWGLAAQKEWIKQGYIPKMPAGMFIYPHWLAGSCVYLSGRSIEGKRHYNMPVGLVGEKHPFFNQVFKVRSEHVVVVEGQADALTLGQWGIPAVALAGVNAGASLVERLKRYDKRIYVALNADAAGEKGVGALAAALGPSTPVVRWPKVNGNQMNDANDWLVSGDGSAEGCRELMADAPIFAEFLAWQVSQAEPLERDAMRRQALEVIASLPPYALAERRRDLAKTLDLPVAVFKEMVKAITDETKKKDGKSAHKAELCIPNGHVDGHLFEMVYQPRHENGPRTLLAVRYPDGKKGLTPVLETDNYRITATDPFDTMLQKNVMRLASEFKDYGDEVRLQQRIQNFIHEYVDVPKEIEVLASYYVMLSWLFDLFYVLPYLRARGMSDSGKSRFISVVGNLCFRACFVTGSTTPSPVFRKIQEWNGLTLVMDEADLPHSETSAEWVQMFNVGYKKEFAILRTAITPSGAKVEAFSAFGPKVLNMRGKFMDDATESRCLTWETSSGRAVRSDIPRFITDFEAFMNEAQEIRNMLLSWRMDRYQSVNIDYNHERTVNMPGRLVEITVPLMSITDSEEFKAKLFEHIEHMNRQAVMDRSATIPAKIFEAILRCQYLPDEKALDGPDDLWLQVAHITRQANRLIDRENEEALAEGEEAINKKRLSAGYVGKVISNELNLQTYKATIGTRPRVVEFDRERFQALILRFGFEEDLLPELVMRGEEAAEKRRQAAEVEERKEAAKGQQLKL